LIKKKKKIFKILSLMEKLAESSQNCRHDDNFGWKNSHS